MPNRFYTRAPFWGALLVAAVIAAILSVPATRNLVARALGSLRMQKVQAVNVDLSPFTDPNANPALHQMVAQMISDKVVVTLNETDQPVPDSADRCTPGRFSRAASERPKRFPQARSQRRARLKHDRRSRPLAGNREGFRPPRNCLARFARQRHGFRADSPRIARAIRDLPAARHRRQQHRQSSDRHAPFRHPIRRLRAPDRRPQPHSKRPCRSGPDQARRNWPRGRAA